MRPLPPGKRQQTGDDRFGDARGHWLCRHVRDNPVVRNITGDNGTCLNNRAGADPYFRADHRAMAEPAIMADGCSQARSHYRHAKDAAYRCYFSKPVWAYRNHR